MTDNSSTIQRSIHGLRPRPSWRTRRHALVLAEHLRASPTFAGCTDDDLTALVEAATPIAVPAEWAFLHEGTPADAAYVLLSGAAKVYRCRRAVAMVGSGDVVGELALIRGGLRNATVSSIDRLTALRIDHEHFDALMAGRPTVRDAIRGVAATRTAKVASAAPCP